MYFCTHTHILSTQGSDLDLTNQVNDHIHEINNAILSASKEAGIVSHKLYKPKAYWAPNLSYHRDRKRFWWSIWVSAGRPGSGVLHDCYKNVKKVFRRESRRAVQKHVDRGHFKLNSLHNQRKMSSCWNKIGRAHV